MKQKINIKLKETPNWLRIFRRIYTYLGATGLASMITVYNLSADTQNKVFFWYGLGAVIIQAVCDFSFKTEPLEDLTPDPKN